MLNRKWLKPILVLSAAPFDFFEWITRKYLFFRQWQTLFPTLIFLVNRNRPFLRLILLKNAIAHSVQKDYCLSQNVQFYINQISLISSTATRGGLDNTLFLYAASPHKNLIKYESSCAPAQMYISGTRSIFRSLNQPTLDSYHTIKKKQIYLYKDYAGSDSFFPHPEIKGLEEKINPGLRAHQISSRTLDLEITPKLKRQWHSFFSAIPQFMAFRLYDSPTTFLSDITKSWTVPLGAVYEREQKLVQLKTESALFHPSEYEFPSFNYISQKWGFNEEKNATGLNFRQSTKRSIEGLFYNPVPDLSYFNPIKDSLDGLKKVALRNETITDKLPVSHERSDITQKTKIDINNLTDRVYRLLEKKIRIEKERRGLYG